MATPFTVGTIECVLLEDGGGGLPAEVLFANAPPAARDAALGQRLGDDGRVHAPYNCLLVRAAGQVVLVDTGLGSVEHPFGGVGGGLEDELAQAGVGPADVDLVVITHGHHDHIGGLCRDGRPRFGRARHLVSRIQWELWNEDGELTDPTATAHDQIPPLAEAGLLEQVDGSEEIVDGVVLIPAPGHSPGQLVVQLGDGGLYLADVIIDALHAEHPDWKMARELDVEIVPATRRRLLGRAADEDLVVAAAHLTSPVRVRRAGDGFELVPLTG